MSRRTRQRQRRRIRLHLNLRSFLPFVVIGLSCLLCVLSGSVSAASPPFTAVDKEEDAIADDTFQTVDVPLSPLEFHISGKLHTDDTELARAKDSLTLAFFRLLRSHYGACLSKVNVKLSLEQIEPMPMPMPLAAMDENEDADPSNDLYLLDRVEEAAILVAEATAALYCRTSDMASLSIKDIDKIIEGSSETFQHVASIVFTSSSPSNDNLYHSLVRIAFNASESKDPPTSTSASRSNDMNSTPFAISSARELNVATGNQGLSAIPTRVLESDVTCVPQVIGRMKLLRGEFICSPSLEYTFGMTQKGDLSLLRNGDKIWSANTRGSYALMQIDGNLVVRASSSWPLWASGTSDNRNASLSLGDNGVVQIVNKNGKRIWKIGKASNPTDKLNDDSNGTAGLDILEGDDNEDMEKAAISCIEQVIGKIRLYANEFICSPDNRFVFGMSNDGDLSLLDQITQPSTKLWSANTSSKTSSYGETYARFQKDGNLVVSTTSGTTLWTSKTAGAGDQASLVLDNSGVVSILDSMGRRVWSARGIGVDVDYYSDDMSDNKFQQRNSNSNSLPLSSSSALDGYTCLDQVVGDKMTFDQGQFICSPDSNWMFGCDNDGDLSLWFGTTKVWSAGTAVGEPTRAKFSSKGNLVVKVVSTNKQLWASKTSGSPGASLFLGNVGNAKITDVDGKKLWIVRGGDYVPNPTPSPTVDPNHFICKNQVIGKIALERGEFICSDVYRFGVSPDNGDLSLWVSVDSSTSIKIWSADSEGASKATLQIGGNLVVRDSTGNPLWTSKTSNNEGASLVLGSDGIANIVSTDGTVLWTTSTPFDGRGAGNGPTPPAPPSFPPTPRITTPPTRTPIATDTPAPVEVDSPTSSAPTSTNGCISVLAGGGRIELYPGQFVCSPSGTYRFGMDSTGDLSLWKKANMKWSAGTGGGNSGSDNHAKLRDDGTLVVRNSEHVLWLSDTSSSSRSAYQGSTIEVHEDGVATITSSTGFYIWSSAAASDELIVDASTLEEKIMAGYQGWFYTDSDGGLNRWQHWSDARTIPDKNTVTIDMWPDMREYDADELADTDFKYSDGSTAGLYSAYNTKTVERHCRWLQDYGIDGLFVQRFIGDALAWPHIRDQVLNNVRSGSEKYGRVFVNMYDIGNGDQRTLVEDIKRDWMHLVDDERITESKSYLHHRGKPVLAMWGWGFTDRIGTPSQAKELITWFQETADPRYQATVMGGVPAGWRTLSRDSRTNSGWSGVYRSFDIISPWTVGRMVDSASADYFQKNYIDPDMAECNSLGIDYLPVVFPGFSSHNLKPDKPFNEIPRLGGNFLWKQLHNVVRSGTTMVYVAMFDETDEGTAIFKTVESADQNPTRGKFLTLDADAGYGIIPSDWYLRLTGAAGRILKDGNRNITETVPANP